MHGSSKITGYTRWNEIFHMYIRKRAYRKHLKKGGGLIKKKKKLALNESCVCKFKVDISDFSLPVEAGSNNSGLPVGVRANTKSETCHSSSLFQHEHAIQF